jgi:hypothetical protein
LSRPAPSHTRNVLNGDDRKSHTVTSTRRNYAGDAKLNELQ